MLTGLLCWQVMFMWQLVLLVMCQSDGGGKAVKKREEIERPAYFHRIVQPKIIPLDCTY